MLVYIEAYFNCQWELTSCNIWTGHLKLILGCSKASLLHWYPKHTTSFAVENTLRVAEHCIVYPWLFGVWFLLLTWLSNPVKCMSKVLNRMFIMCCYHIVYSSVNEHHLVNSYTVLYLSVIFGFDIWLNIPFLVTNILIWPYIFNSFKIC